MSVRKTISGIFTAIGLIIALTVLAIGGFALWAVHEDKADYYLARVQTLISGEEASELHEPLEDPLEVLPFADYSWEELSRISRLLEEAESEAAAQDIALSFNLIDDSGHLDTSRRLLVLGDGRALEIYLAGILHDVRSDGSRIGLSFIANSLPARQMNATQRVEGGWEASSIRSYLNEEAIELFPADFLDYVVNASKTTNNIGILATGEFDDIDVVGSLSTTEDRFWLFSSAELCGEISWFSREFSSAEYGYGFRALDEVLSSEGHQYQRFAEHGVSDQRDPSGILIERINSEAKNWWTRSVYPLDYASLNVLPSFYQVYDSGYPAGVGAADSEAIVVFGFCL